jgi:Ca-activated chloride channel family protein
MSRLALSLLLVAVAASAAGAWDPLQSARRAAADGQRALAEGDTTSAIRDMMRAQALAPEDPEIRMGLGETLYRATEYESARRQYESIGADPAAGIPSTALYNAGNSAFDSGDLEAALDLYTRALLEAEGDAPADLLHNLELTQRLLQQQQEQQEQSGEDQSDEQNEDSGEQQDQPDQQQQEQQQDQQQEQQDQQQQEQEQQQEDQQQAPPEEQEQPSEPEEQPAGEEEQQMSPEEAMRLLQALDADEEELRKSIQRRLRGDEKETEHDW